MKLVPEIIRSGISFDDIVGKRYRPFLFLWVTSLSLKFATSKHGSGRTSCLPYNVAQPYARLVRITDSIPLVWFGYTVVLVRDCSKNVMKYHLQTNKQMFAVPIMECKTRCSKVCWLLVGWGLWHINLCRLFNAKSILYK